MHTELLPNRKETIILNDYKNNLSRWNWSHKQILFYILA